MILNFQIVFTLPVGCNTGSSPLCSPRTCPHGLYRTEHLYSAQHGRLLPQRRQERRHRERVCALSPAEGAAQAGGRHLVRRRAADAGHGPRPDEPSPAADAG